MKNILIAGGGIAGPALAYWLTEYGFNVTLTERRSTLGLGGHNIDVTGAAVEVIKKMGIYEAVKSQHTGEQGLIVVDKDNHAQAEFPKQSPIAMTQDLEILRGDLVEILYNLTSDRSEYHFASWITEMQQGENAVYVKFNDNRQEKYDLVIGADGMNSPTRTQLFPDLDPCKYLGIWTSYFTIPRVETDTDWAQWYNAPGGIVIILRPDAKGTIRVSVNFLNEDHHLICMTLDEKKDKIQKVLYHNGWKCSRIAKALEQCTDVFLGPLEQILLEHWHMGRCALVGDAAYCPSPLAGKGTSAALIGSYVLAGELAKTPDFEYALSQYQKKMMPYISNIQKLPLGLPRLAYPKSKTGVSLIQNVAGFIASSPIQNLICYIKNHQHDRKEEFNLPLYV